MFVFVSAVYFNHSDKLEILCNSNCFHITKFDNKY